MLKVKYSEMWGKMKTLLTWYTEVHTLEHKEFLLSSVFRV